MSFHLSGSLLSTCIQQSAPDGYFREEDCLQFNPFICEIDQNSSFSEPKEGTRSRYCRVFKFTYIYNLENYIVSPNFPSSYPNNYEEVNLIILLPDIMALLIADVATEVKQSRKFHTHFRLF